MIIFSVLFGKVPDSYYKTYWDWFKRHHGVDIEAKNIRLPFIPPNGDSFIYDPLCLNLNGDIQED